MRAGERYRDRREAGCVLASYLRHCSDWDNGLILALPRGGVPVAREVARELNWPLDLLFVRKLGAPGHEELAMGAIASGGVKILNENIASRFPVEAIERAAERGLREIERQNQVYRGGSAVRDLEDAACILVDDGLATGATMLAAIAALRQCEVGRCVVAAPVAPPDTCARIEHEADELVCPLRPSDFAAVGQYYADFSQTTDEEVRDALR